MTQAWWSGLKEGDEVGLRSGYRADRPKIVKIDRVTPTGQIVINGRRFKADKHNPSYVGEIGEKYYRATLVSVEEALEDQEAYDRQIQREREANKLKNFNWKNLSDEKRAAISEILGLHLGLEINKPYLVDGMEAVYIKELQTPDGFQYSFMMADNDSFRTIPGSEMYRNPERVNLQRADQ